MKFKVIEDGKEITCEIIKLFADNSNNIDYVIYTDGTIDENKNKKIYASRYVIEDNSLVLRPIENDYEWNLIDNMLDSISKEGR